MEKTYLSTSFEDTQEFGLKTASDLKKGTTICLFGELASGKTTFSQGIAKFLDISRLVSPTYIIMKSYPVISHPVIKKLYHIDLYRLETKEDIKAFDIDEIWNDDQNLVLVEWPEKFENILPKERLDVYIKSLSDREREIKIITQS